MGNSGFGRKKSEIRQGEVVISRSSEDVKKNVGWERE